MEICVWADGTWCDKDNLEEHLMGPCAMSDDFGTYDVGDSTEEQIEAFVEKVSNGLLS